MSPALTLLLWAFEIQDSIFLLKRMAYKIRHSIMKTFEQMFILM
ncbi:hypothetical protein DJ90_2515 [Paenibacillus macerans]|uniref:Uncharacterized protein n=1 Tax=Paenibacillus macerans TaxID=44252 RepID=A0A090ZKY2_PAEMA|nr:hypothetical protein DJ90_2515 [Paenibacillus macerans]